jgi:hypothetical protein
MADFDEAARIEPKNPDAVQYRAWAWATCPNASFRDAEKAVAAAEGLCNAYENNPDYVETLAAAYAEAGDFDAAVKWQIKAVAMFTDADSRTKGEARLKLYREKKPYRDGEWPHAPDPSTTRALLPPGIVTGLSIAIAGNAEMDGGRAESQVINTKNRLEIYRVEQVNGPWLWLRARELSGWFPPDEVVPVEQAMDFFTE